MNRRSRTLHRHRRPPLAILIPSPSRAAGVEAGFTLIELLVVIAIIAILASLLLPALSRSRASAHSAVCKGNLRQWGMAMRMYLDDFNKYPSNSGAPPGGDGKSWFQRLESYTGSKWPRWNGRRFEPANSIAVCPGYARLPGQFYSNDGADGGGYGGYEVNQVGAVPIDHDVEVRLGIFSLGLIDAQTPETRVANPSEMYAIGDALISFFNFSSGFGYAPPGEAIIGWGNLNPTDTRAMALWPEFGLTPKKREERDWVRLRALNRRRHGGQFNMVLCDGHAEGLKLPSLFDVRRDDVLRRWNRDNQPHREAAANLW